jgi:peroxiredoxin
MALTYSQATELGSIAPDFQLPDVISGKEVTLDALSSEKATVVMFICNHCPYVKHILDKVVEVAKEYQTKGVKVIAISSNDVETYPQDSPEAMKELAAVKDFSFPYLYDANQQVAKSYAAACTPEFYILNGEKRIVYHGRFDPSSPGKPVAVTGEDLIAALDAVLNHLPVPQPQHPSMGCNIKWKND